MMMCALVLVMAMFQQQTPPPQPQDPQATPATTQEQPATKQDTQEKDKQDKQEQPQEPKKIPKDSVEVAATGCLKGKAFAALAPREEGVAHGPDVRGRTFRLDGPKDLMKDVKKNDGHLVEVVGLVRKMDLQQNGIQGHLGGMRVGVGSPSGTAPMGGGVVGAPDPASGVVIMDISSLRTVADTCTFPRR
jgi:hypothetical protein